jgi:hypothetical protein
MGEELESEKGGARACPPWHVRRERCSRDVLVRQG